MSTRVTRVAINLGSGSLAMLQLNHRNIRIYKDPDMSNEQVMLLKNGVLLDVESGELSKRDILISGNRIQAVGGGLSHSGARIINLKGRTVMPGLIDLHVHICADGMVPGSNFFPAMAAASAGKLLNDSLMRGFTTLRDAGGADLGYKQALSAGLFVGPRLKVSGRMISQTGGHGDFRQQSDECPACFAAAQWTHIADGEPEVRKAVREELRRGADQIKIMASGGVASPSDPLDGLQYSDGELAAAVDEARRAHTYVLAHAYSSDAIKRCIIAGCRTIEHGNFLDEEAAAMMVASGAYLVPTLVVYRMVTEHGKALGISSTHFEKAREVLATGTRSLEIARRAGVKMGFGSDLFRAPKQYQSDEFLIRAEVLPALEIIQSATLIGAEVIRMSDRLGQVKEGYLADLIVVDGNPLDDLKLLTNQGQHLPVIIKDGVVYKNTTESPQPFNLV